MSVFRCLEAKNWVYNGCNIHHISQGSATPNLARLAQKGEPRGR